MFKRRGIILFVIIAVLLIGAALPGGASAQDDPAVRVVPVMGELLIAELSPDGRTLAVFDNINFHNDYEVIPEHLPIQLVDLDSGEVSWLLGFSDHAWAVAFSPDSTRLVSAHGNGEVFLWDVASHTMISQLWVYPGMRALALLPDNNTLIANMSTTYTQIGQWDLTTGYMTALMMDRYATYGEFRAQVESSPANGVIGLDVAPDGETLAAVTSYGRIWRWDLTTHEPTLLVDSESTQPMLDIMRLAYLADGSTIVYLNRREGILHFVDATSGAETQTIEVATRFEPAMLPDGSRVFWFDKEAATIKQWEAGKITDLNLPPVPLTADLDPAPASPMPVLFLTPDGTRLVFTGFEALGSGINAVAIIDLE